MHDPEPHRRLLLELSHEEPLAGRIWPARGEPRPFLGWIGLAATLSAWLSETEPRPGETEGP